MESGHKLPSCPLTGQRVWKANGADFAEQRDYFRLPPSDSLPLGGLQGDVLEERDAEGGGGAARAVPHHGGGLGGEELDRHGGLPRRAPVQRTPGVHSRHPGHYTRPVIPCGTMKFQLLENAALGNRFFPLFNIIKETIVRANAS